MPTSLMSVHPHRDGRRLSCSPPASTSGSSPATRRRQYLASLDDQNEIEDEFVRKLHSRCSTRSLGSVQASQRRCCAG